MDNYNKLILKALILVSILVHIIYTFPVLYIGFTKGFLYFPSLTIIGSVATIINIFCDIAIYKEFQKLK